MTQAEKIQRYVLKKLAERGLKALNDEERKIINGTGKIEGRMGLIFVGANSPGALRTRRPRFIIADDFDAPQGGGLSTFEKASRRGKSKFKVDTAELSRFLQNMHAEIWKEFCPPQHLFITRNRTL